MSSSEENYSDDDYEDYDDEFEDDDGEFEDEGEDREETCAVIVDHDDSQVLKNASRHEDTNPLKNVKNKIFDHPENSPTEDHPPLVSSKDESITSSSNEKGTLLHRFEDDSYKTPEVDDVNAPEGSKIRICNDRREGENEAVEMKKKIEVKMHGSTFVVESGSTKIVETWNVHCMHINENISFFDRGKKNEGTFIGLNDEGFAKIDVNGKIETFNSINIT